MMNVRRKDMERVVKLLPALQNPTVSALIDPDWVALNTVVEEKIVREIIPELMKAGAHGIIEYSLNKVVQ
jgi:ATP phosphoribosyltransferase